MQGAIPGSKTPQLRYQPNGNCCPGLVATEVRNGLPEHRKPYLWRGRPGLAELNARILEERAERAAKVTPPRFTDCGTPAAYRRHRKLRETPCAACKKAAREERAKYSRAADYARYWNRKAAGGAAREESA